VVKDKPEILEKIWILRLILVRMGTGLLEWREAACRSPVLVSRDQKTLTAMWKRVL